MNKNIYNKNHKKERLRVFKCFDHEWKKRLIWFNFFFKRPRNVSSVQIRICMLGILMSKIHRWTKESSYQFNVLFN